MSYGVDYPNISTGNLFTAVDPYVATGTQTNQNQWPNGALNPPGAVYAMNTWGQLYSQYAGYSSTFAPFVTVLGTTATSTSVTSVSTTEQLVVGMTVTGSGVAAGTTITAITSTTAITLSKATTSSVTLCQLSCFFSTKIFNGAPPVVKYVRYLSQNNPSLLAYPGAVYYTDSTCTTVTGYSSEVFGTVANYATQTWANAGAGWLLYNSTASGLTGAASATALNGNWCWIQVGGLLPGAAAVSSTVIGDSLSASITSAQSFTVVRTAAGTANPYINHLGVAWSGLSTNTTCDVMVNPLLAQI
jgi:hypothetical protein